MRFAFLLQIVLEIENADIDSNMAVRRLARRSHFTFDKKTEDTEVRKLAQRLYQLLVCVSQSPISVQLCF